MGSKNYKSAEIIYHDINACFEGNSEELQKLLDQELFVKASSQIVPEGGKIIYVKKNFPDVFIEIKPYGSKMQIKGHLIKKMYDDLLKYEKIKSIIPKSENL